MKIYKEKCNECLFTKNRIVSVERYKELIQDCLERDKRFICHKSTINGESICCRWFYDVHGKDVLPIRLAKLLWIEEFIDWEENEQK